MFEEITGKQWKNFSLDWDEVKTKDLYLKDIIIESEDGVTTIQIKFEEDNNG